MEKATSSLIAETRTLLKCRLFVAPSEPTGWLADEVQFSVYGGERLRRRLASSAPLRACRAYAAGARVIAPPPRIAT